MVTDRHSVAVAFGRTLRDARIKVGVSQEQLAELANIDRTYPSLLESGLRTPTLTAYLDISRALNLKPESLLQETLLQLGPNMAKTTPAIVTADPTPAAPT